MTKTMSDIVIQKTTSNTRKARRLKRAVCDQYTDECAPGQYTLQQLGEM